MVEEREEEAREKEGWIRGERWKRRYKERGCGRGERGRGERERLIEEERGGEVGRRGEQVVQG